MHFKSPISCLQNTSSLAFKLFYSTLSIRTCPLRYLCKVPLLRLAQLYLTTSLCAEVCIWEHIWCSYVARGLVRRFRVSGQLSTRCHVNLFGPSHWGIPLWNAKSLGYLSCSAPFSITSQACWNLPSPSCWWGNLRARWYGFLECGEHS